MARSAKALLRGSSIPAIAAFVASALAGAAHAGTLSVGPVGHVDVKNSTVVVLGQTYQIGPSATIENQAGVRIGLSSLTPNTLVTIDGTETSKGQTTVSSVTRLLQVDVPGATPLLVTGIVSAETATGQIKVGNLAVDINATLTSDRPQFAIGSLVEISGTQPNPNGLFLAKSIVSINSITAQGVEGGGHLTSLGVEGGGLNLKAQGVEGGGRTSAMGVEGGGHLTSLGVEGGGLQ